jgi:hypothetical protein
LASTNPRPRKSKKRARKNVAKNSSWKLPVIKDKPIAAPGVERYLESKFADSLAPVRDAMRDLAKAFRPEDLSQNAFQLYEKFRPAIPQGVTGWGAKGRLEIDRIRSLASEK